MVASFSQRWPLLSSTVTFLTTPAHTPGGRVQAEILPFGPSQQRRGFTGAAGQAQSSCPWNLSLHRVPVVFTQREKGGGRKGGGARTGGGKEGGAGGRKHQKC